MVVLEDSTIKVCEPEDAASVLQNWLKERDAIDQDKEYGMVLVLNTRKRLIVMDMVTVGILNATLMHPREVFRRAIVYGGDSVILAHNHPSSDCTPSDEDKDVTERMRKAGIIIGIEFVDHIIFSRDGYYSFQEERLL